MASSGRVGCRMNNYWTLDLGKRGHRDVSKIRAPITEWRCATSKERRLQLHRRECMKILLRGQPNVEDETKKALKFRPMWQCVVWSGIPNSDRGVWSNGWMFSSRGKLKDFRIESAPLLLCPPHKRHTSLPETEVA